MDVQVNPGTLGFQIPTFGEMLTFIVKGFFVIAGIATLIMLLWGALAWVLSGGDKEQVEAARDRITAALVGLFLILVALSTIWTLEQIVFQRTICFGLSCPVSIPTLLRSNSGSGSSNSSHIFAKPTPSGGTTNSQQSTTNGSGQSSNGAGSTNSRLTPTNWPTPTGLRQLPGTGL